MHTLPKCVVFVLSQMYIIKTSNTFDKENLYG